VNLNGDPVLSNKVGGLSGTGIRPLALRSVSRVREAVGAGPIIIGMGGISTPDDIRQFHLAGADFFGIGSALTGMDSQRMSSYFDELAMALEPAGTAGIQTGLAEIPMDYFPATLAARQEYGPGLFKLVLDRLPIAGQAGELAGRYVFLFIPGAGEKPFAVFSAKDKSIVIKAVGKFTQHLASVALGSRVYLRGPYGRQFPKLQRKQVVLVGGGTGIASLPEIGELLRGENELHFLLGGRSAHDVFEEETFAKLGTVRVATNDGSKGRQGFVTELLREWVPADGDPSGKKIFVLCGPEPMVEACRKLLQPSVRPENIWAAIEYMTSCGVGICGKCASPGGSLTCIDGPFMLISAFEERKSDETSCAVPASAH
jgi:dihydroorotate dehydrogenase (NAD+) catalytic subunit